MKKIIFLLIMAVAVTACHKNVPPAAYLDADGNCIFENNVVRYRIAGNSNPAVIPGMEAILIATGEEDELIELDRHCAVELSMNDGGSAVVFEDSLYFPQENFSSFEIVEQTGAHVIFKLEYPKWQVGEYVVALTRTITLRYNSYFCEVADDYSGLAGKPLKVAVGYEKHEVLDSETGKDYMITWERLPEGNGEIGLCIAVPMTDDFVFDGPNNQAVAYVSTSTARKVQYAAGFCWSRGEVPDFETWAEMVRL